MVRVLICDDQAVVREGLAAILSTDDEIEVVGLARHGAEALVLTAETSPDVVLMDLSMPVMNGVQAMQRLRVAQPGVAVLVLTTYADDAWVMDAIRAGAAGYLLKDTRRDELLAAVKGTAKGKTFVDPNVAGTLLRQAAAPAPANPVSRPSDAEPVEPLTDRELEVLRLLAQGYSNPEIGRQLHLAAGTVRNYVSVILQKLHVTDRTQAAVAAVQRGLISQPLLRTRSSPE
jgi:DNA-binding NarL/FixJ family response regulator